MTTEQAHQRLGIAEGVIHELQEQLQRVSAGHQAAHEALQSIHQEMNTPFFCRMSVFCPRDKEKGRPTCPINVRG